MNRSLRREQEQHKSDIARLLHEEQEKHHKSLRREQEQHKSDIARLLHEEQEKHKSDIAQLLRQHKEETVRLNRLLLIEEENRKHENKSLAAHMKLLKQAISKEREERKAVVANLKGKSRGM